MFRGVARRVVERLEDRVLLSAVSFTGAGDGISWTDPKNWSSGTVPGPADDVTINLPGHSVAISDGVQSVRSVNTSDPLQISGGTLAVTAGLTLTGTLSLGSPAGAGGHVLFVGSQTLAGSGQVVFNDPSNTSAIEITGTAPANVLTIASGITIHGAGGEVIPEGEADSIINDGTIRSDAGGTLAVGGETNAIENDGVLAVSTGSTLEADGLAAPSTGAILVSGGMLNLGGTFTTAALDLPKFIHSGGTVNLVGRLENASATLPLTAFTGSFTLAGGTISGGTITGNGGASLVLTAAGGTLDGVTANLNLDLSRPSANATVTGGLTLNGTALLSGDFSHLDFAGTGFLLGTGAVVFGDATVNALRVRDSGGSLTLGSGITVRGGSSKPSSATIGFNPLIGGPQDVSVTNFGTIAPDVAGATIQVNANNFSNGGTINQLNGGVFSLVTRDTLRFISGNVTLSGPVTANKVIINAGDVSLNSATPVTIQSLTLTGGALDGSAAVNLTGVSAFTGGTMTGTGTTTITPTGTVTVSGTVGSERPLNNSGTLAVAAGSIELDGNGSHVGTFTVATDATLEFGGSSSQDFMPASTLTGAGTVMFQENVAADISGAYNATGTALADQADVTYTVSASTGTLTETGGNLTIGGTDTGRPGRASRVAGGTFDVLTQSVFADGATNVLPGWTLRCAGTILFSGPGNPIINLTASDAAPGRLTLGGDLTFVDPTGVAVIRSTGPGANPGQIDLGGATRSFTISHASGGKDLSVSAQITNGALRKAGTGELQLTGPSTYAGGTILSSGTLEVDNSAGVGTGPITFAGGALAVAPGVSLPNPVEVAPTNSVNLDVGNAAMQLSGVALGAALNVTGQAGGSLTINGPLALRHDLVINNNVPLTLNGTIEGSFSLTKTGPGTLTLAGNAGNLYAGPTEVDVGTLQLAKTSGIAIPSDLRINGPATVRLQAPNQINPSAAVTFDATGGTPVLDLNNFSQTLGSINSFQPGAGAITLGTGTLTVATGTYTGTISGPGTVVKPAAGTLTFGSSLNGPALVLSAGTIALSGSGNNVVSALSLGNGAKLDLGRAALTIRYGAGTPPVSTVRGLIVSSAIFSAASPTIGFGDGANGIVRGLSPGSLLIRAAVGGDANLDGTVDFADVLAVAQHFAPGGTTWDEGDFNYDGKVNFSDVLLMAQNYDKTLGQPLRRAKTGFHRHAGLVT